MNTTALQRTTRLGVCAIIVVATCGLLALAAAGTEGQVEVDAAVRDAWQVSGAGGRFELAGMNERSVGVDDAAPTRIWMNGSLSSTAWAEVCADLDGAGAPVIVAEGDPWPVRGLRSPGVASLRVYSGSDASARRLAAQLADVDRWRVVDRHTPVSGATPVRRTVAVRFGWRARSGLVRRLGAQLGRSPVTATEAREFTAYHLIRDYALRSVAGREVDPSDAVAVVLVSASEQPEEFVNRVVDWFTCRGGALPLAAWAGLDAWAAQPDLRDEVAAARKARVQRARSASASGVISIGSPDWRATFSGGGAGAGTRWRTHFALSASPKDHRRSLVDCLSASYPEAMDAAEALWFFGHLGSETGLVEMDSVPEAVRCRIALGMIASGRVATGVALLDSVVSRDAGGWSPDAAWWGEAEWYPSAFEQYWQRRGVLPATQEWLELLERTQDPFVAVSAENHILGVPEVRNRINVADLDRSVQRCIDRALALRGGEVAALAALQHATCRGPAAEEWVREPARRQRLEAAIGAVLSDERLPSDDRVLLQSRMKQIWR